MILVPKEAPERHILGQNVFGAIMDEANFLGPRGRGLLNRGTPVRHIDMPDVVGVVQGHVFDDEKIYYQVEWIVEGSVPMAPMVLKEHVRELPSPLHLLASVG